jgi:hypothetical protein
VVTPDATPPAVRTGEDDGTDVERVAAALRQRMDGELWVSARDANELAHVAIAALSARPLVSGTANRDDVARWLSDRYGARVDPLDHFPGHWLRDADELLALLGGDQDTAQPRYITDPEQTQQWQDEREQGHTSEQP